MSTIAFLIVIALLSWALLKVHRRWSQAARADYIRSYMFPPGVFDKLRSKHPGLTASDVQLVARGLRQFYLAYLKSGCQFVSMPSQVVDDLWHEMILYTRNYDAFCKKAFGRFLHHTPAVVLSPSKRDNAGLRRTWWHVCLDENINPRKPTRLPLLFALDKKLNIPQGFVYAPNCAALRAGGARDTYCGADFGSSSTDGSTDGFGDMGSSSSSDHGGHHGGHHSGDGGGSDGSSSDGGGSGDGGGGCGGD